MTAPTNPADDDLRRVLRDAVSDVHPRDALDDIRSRTDKVVPMKRWFLSTLAVAAVTAAVVGGAFWLVNDDDSSRVPADTPSPAATTGPTGGSSTPATTMRAIPVYFVGETAHGKKLYREFQREACDDSNCVLRASAAHAVNGAPLDPDYVSAWPAGSHVLDARYDGDQITIDLAGDVHDKSAQVPSEAAAKLAIQQLVYSAQAGLGQGRVPVQLLIDGKHTDTVLGVPASEPLAADNPDDVLAPVQIDTPADGADVSGTFTVSGRAAAFEANVVWELMQGDKVVKQGFETAQECCTLSPYSFQVTAPPGDYTLVVHDTDESGGGRPVDQDTKEITIR